MLAAGFVFADNENYDGQDVSGKNFSKISHRYSSWIGVTAKGTIFSGHYGSETSYVFSNFTNATLTKADFTSANLLGTAFTNANLSEASLGEANVQDADFTNANLSGAWLMKVKNLTDTQLRSASDITKIYIDNISKFNLSGLNMSGAYLRDANVQDANFTNANLSGADLHDANVQDANFTNANLSGASLWEVKNLTDTQLRSASDITKIHIVNVSKFNLSGLNMSGAWLHGANAQDANFTNANLSGASLGEANVQDVNFTNANLSGASLWEVKNLTDTQLRSASDITKISIDNVSKFNLSGLNMSGAYLSGANAEDADFSNADLTDAELDNANLSGANFTRAVLSGTSTNGADFTNAIIQGADLSSMVSSGFTEAQLKTTASYKEGNLTGVMFDYNNISKWDLSNQNLQNASFFATRITSVNFTNSDLRGAETTATSGAAIYKNTILADGVIKNFAMASSADNLTIRKYTPATSGGEMISAKVSESDATVSGGATLKLDTGARLDVVNKKTLTIASDAMFVIDTSISDPTQVYIESLAGLVIDGKLTVNITEDLLDNVEYRFDVILFEDDSSIACLEDLKPDENLYLTIKGKTFNGYWSCEMNENKFTILATQVPEPATIAAIFGALALGLAVYRRRK